MKNDSWVDKVGNISQVGGIETSILDNGPAKGSRIAWINTGSGLRYKIAIDRALDIVDTFYNQHSLAWISNNGITAPNPAASQGVEWLHSFAGGLLTTCGLTHIGGPEEDESSQRGLHGRISNIPAILESIQQPDPTEGNLEMSITAKVTQSKVFGPHVELKRTISSTLGQSTIKIHDVVTNRGNTPAPHMILYHCNFGWPLIDEGVDIVYRGKCESRGMDMDSELFNDKHDYKKCQKTLDSHKGGGESAGFIDVKTTEDGVCNVGFVNDKLNIALAMKYKKQQLPCLTNWQHWGQGEYVCALEPGTNPPIGQNKAKEQDKLIYLEPGEKRTYDLEISVLTNKEQIEEFTKIAG